MSILETYLLGLAVAHLAWFYFFTTGQLLRTRHHTERNALSLADLVSTSVAGMALVGFALVLLGFTHLLTRQGILVGVVVEGILFWWLRRENWFSWRFWRDTLQKMVRGWTPAACFIYVVMVLVGVPAVLPPSGGDPVSYHLAYAVDWANAGRIYVDPFLRFPFYANNFLLLYSALFVLKLGRYCQFLTWLCGLLTCLGILAFFTRADVWPRCQSSASKWFQPQEFLIPLGVGLSPTFLHYLNVGMLDVPIGLFVLVPILCAYRGSTHRPLKRELVVTGAFCAGMKLTLIGEVPLFVASLFFACAPRVSWRKSGLLCLALLGLSLPWYVRNLTATRDPVPPTFNMLFKHPDPIYTPWDVSLYTRGLASKKDPVDLLLLPFRFFTAPRSPDLGEPGVSAMIVLLYAPVIFLLTQLWLRRRCRSPSRFIYLSATVIYLAAPWFVSSAGRHSLHWYPVLAAWVGAVISHLGARLEARWSSWPGVLSTRLASAAFSCALICPTPSPDCLHFYRAYYAGTLPLSSPRRQLKAYLKSHVRHYRESRAVIEALSPRHRNDRVLLFGRATPHFFFRQAKIVSVGDYFGPARYGDLTTQVTQGDCRPYLNQLGISAIVVDPQIAAEQPTMYQKFQSQLNQNGFLEYRCRKGSVPVFLKSDIPPSPRLTRVTGDLPPSVP
jgi:hypothetical protein